MKKLSENKIKDIDDLSLYIKQQNYGKVFSRVPFKDLTTIKIGGNIKLLFYPNSEKALVDVLRIIKKNHFKYFIIGNGSNVLANDNFYDGIVIKLKDLNDYIKINDNFVEVGAGIGMAKLIFSLMKENLGGLEFLVGIPATIGGMVCMNAGAFNHSVSEFIEEIKIVNDDGKIEKIKKEKLYFSYRDSIVKEKKYIILSVRFKLIRKEKELIKKDIRKYLGIRKNKQPIDSFNAGCVFKNNINNSGKLIDECDLKGFSINDAMVSEKHANFLINKEKASAFEMMSLIYYVKDIVRREKNIELECEWVFINFDFEENVV